MSFLFGHIAKKNRSTRLPILQFKPTDLFGLSLWIDASQVTGKVNGDLMDSLPDYSGNGIAVNYAAARAVYTTNQINSKPAFYFDGTKSYISNLNQIAGDKSIFIVLKRDSIVGTSQLEISGNSTSSGHALGRISSGTLEGKANIGLSTLTVTYNSHTSYFIKYFTRIGGDEFMKAGNVSSTASNVVDSTASVYVISQTSGGFTFAGYIAEILVYKTGLSTIDAALVENYLKTKYAL